MHINNKVMINGNKDNKVMVMVESDIHTTVSQADSRLVMVLPKTEMAIDKSEMVMVRSEGVTFPSHRNLPAFIACNKVARMGPIHNRVTTHSDARTTTKGKIAGTTTIGRGKQKANRLVDHHRKTRQYTN